MENKPRKLSKQESKAKAQHFCAYQERSQKEVRSKLYSYGLYTDEVEETLSELIMDGFINEERFAIAFVGGKFRMKKWGRQKIMMALSQHDISEYCCKKGLQEIDEEEYVSVIQALVIKKANSTKEQNDYIKRNKVASYVISRGFEPELVWETIKEEIP